MFSGGMFTICIFFKYTAFCYQLCVNYVSIVTKNVHLSNFQATVHQLSNYSLNPLSMGPLWSWSYGSWIYNYLCNQCLSPL